VGDVAVGDGGDDSKNGDKAEQVVGCIVFIVLLLLPPAGGDGNGFKPAAASW